MVSDKLTRCSSLEEALNNKWSQEGHIQVEPLKANFFQLSFNSEVLRHKVFQSSPWIYKNQFLLMHVWDQLQAIESLSFSSVILTVHLKDLPLPLRTLDIASYLGERLGEVKECSLLDTSGRKSSYIRLKVVIDISKPLVYKLNMNAGRYGPLTAAVRYEKLPMYCYYCLLIGHAEIDCDVRIIDSLNGCLADKSCIPNLRAIPGPSQHRNMVDRTTQFNLASQLAQLSVHHASLGLGEIHSTADSVKLNCSWQPSAYSPNQTVQGGFDLRFSFSGPFGTEETNRSSMEG